MKQFEKHQGVFFRHLLRIASFVHVTKLFGYFGALSHRFDSFYLFFLILDLAFKSHHITGFVTPTDLRVVLSIIVQATMAL